MKELRLEICDLKQEAIKSYGLQCEIMNMLKNNNFGTVRSDSVGCPDIGVNGGSDNGVIDITLYDPSHSQDLIVIKLIHLCCLAVSCAESVLCYRTLPLICTSPCAIINTVPTIEEGRCRRGGRKGRVLCYAHHHAHLIIINQSAQQKVGGAMVWCEIELIESTVE